MTYGLNKLPEAGLLGGFYRGAFYFIVTQFGLQNQGISADLGLFGGLLFMATVPACGLYSGCALISMCV